MATMRALGDRQSGRRRLATALALIAFTTLCAGADATSEAQKRFDEGKVLYRRAHDVDGARLKFAQAYALQPRPEVLWNLAICELEAGLAEAPIRWIADDALTFVKREGRRGRRYDGIILDPPKYGRGPNGEIWRLEEGLGELLDACAAILAPGGFVIATLYAVRLSALSLASAARDAFGAAGTWESGEMCLPHASDDRLLSTAIFTRGSGLSGAPSP